MENLCYKMQCLQKNFITFRCIPSMQSCRTIRCIPILQSSLGIKYAANAAPNLDACKIIPWLICLFLSLLVTVATCTFILACNHSAIDMSKTSCKTISKLIPLVFLCCNYQNSSLYSKLSQTCTFILACNNNAMNMFKSSWKILKELELSCVYLGLTFEMHTQHAVFFRSWLCYKMLHRVSVLAEKWARTCSCLILYF